MVRTITSHYQSHEEEDDDAEDVAAGTDTSSHREGKSAEQKPSNYRSKHSETEQRRRSKINERFQILRDLIPPNDQKRDKASLLLEVIEYIQFLQEKLQVYEGPYQQQVWSQEPTKLIPWRANHGPSDNFANHSQAFKNGFLDENTAVQPMTTMQGSVESDFSGEFAYRTDHHPSGSVNPVVPLNMPLQPCTSPSRRGILPVENRASHCHGSSIAEGAIIGTEEKTFERGSSSVSDVYSQGLLKKLTQSLQTSGVDLSQANISVQLDVGKGVNSGSDPNAPILEDVDNQSPNNQPVSHTVELGAKDSVQAAKRLRTGES
ncbi:Transcription factor BIM2 [Bienertia sinuspersici]